MCPSFQPSGISINIRESLVSGSSRTQTTLNIDPIITKDGHRVVMSDVGDIGFAKIDQGTDNEEILSYTGITDNTTTMQLTGVVWGYNFYDGIGDVDANKKSHSSGASFIITNDFHYLSEQYLSKDDFDPDANELDLGDGTTDNDKKLNADNGDANNPFLAYDESEDEWVFSNDGTSTTAMSSVGAVGTGGDGIDITASTVSLDIAASSKVISDGGTGDQLDLTGDTSDALDGSSGTPSSSNTFITEDDVTEAKTASKVARRDSNGDLLVTTTPTDGDAAASKTYIEAQDVANSIINQLDNKYYLIGSDLQVTANGGTLTQTSNVMSAVTASGTGENESFYDQETDEVDSSADFDFIVRFKNAGATQNSVFVGITGAYATMPSVAGALTTDHAGFIIGGSTIYSSTGDGSTQTSNSISGVTIADYNNYRITRDGSNILFYVNGSLKFTHTTNLPDDTSVQLAFSVNNGDGGDGARSLYIIKNYIFIQ
jgi:hypothetical protein